MESWDSVSHLFRIQQHRTQTPYAEVATKMMDLIDQLRADERFVEVQVASAGMGIQLGKLGNKGGVYVEWHFDTKEFQIGIDYREPPYKIEFKGVDDTEIITTIYKRLQTLKLNRITDDPMTSSIDKPE